MKISYNWLKDFIETDKTAEQIGELLTGCGLEVEDLSTYNSIPGGLEGIVIGKVISAEKHPNADKLRVCKVDIGNDTVKQIVCGAPNVASNQTVLVATVGSTVHPLKGEPFAINKAKIRGEISEGMICAEDELSLGNSHDGILVLSDHYKAGTPAKEAFEIYSDQVFEIGLTANRGDAASHLGVARDLKALGITRKPLPNEAATLTEREGKTIRVTIEDHEACKRYSGLSVYDITVKPSPAWLQNRLRAIGLSPINNIVDATNYILHALGQPLHAFDADKIAGEHIIVKRAKKDSSFITLDKAERKLTGNECMICDEEKPLAIAGVFGGQHSGINENTKNIFIESAYFNAGNIRKAAKSHGLNTDASFRFERGTDPNITVKALEMAAALIMEIADGKGVSKLTDVYPEPIQNRQIVFNPKRSNDLIGKEITYPEMLRILTDLEMEVTQTNNAQWQLSVPPYRVDVERPVDITEEILRIYGLNNIETDSEIRSAMTFSKDEAGLKLKNRLANYLSANGFFEIATNTLTSPAFYSEEQLSNAVKILNPLSNELAIMRMDLLDSFLESVQYNNNRKNSNLRFYEFGKTYHRKGDEINLLSNYREQKHLGIVMLGRKTPESWNNGKEELSYFSLKNVVEQTLKQCGLNTVAYAFKDDQRFENATQISIKKREIGVFGQLARAVTVPYDIEKPLWYADLDMDAIVQLAAQVEFKRKPVPVFPSVRRDLAMVLSNETSYNQLEKTALKTEPKLIKQINVFDVYQGDKIGAGKKSYALSFILQDDAKTLTDEEIDGVMKKLISNFEKETGAVLRG